MIFTLEEWVQIIIWENHLKNYWMKANGTKNRPSSPWTGNAAFVFVKNLPSNRPADMSTISTASWHGVPATQDAHIVGRQFLDVTTRCIAKGV